MIYLGFIFLKENPWKTKVIESTMDNPDLKCEGLHSNLIVTFAHDWIAVMQRRLATVAHRALIAAPWVPCQSSV
jgi:hypothetical protein